MTYEEMLQMPMVAAEVERLKEQHVDLRSTEGRYQVMKAVYEAGKHAGTIFGYNKGAREQREAFQKLPWYKKVTF